MIKWTLLAMTMRKWTKRNNKQARIKLNPRLLMNISGPGMQVPNNQHLHMHELRRYDFPIFWFDFLYILADYNCIAQVFSFLLFPFSPLFTIHFQSPSIFLFSTISIPQLK